MKIWLLLLLLMLPVQAQPRELWTQGEPNHWSHPSGINLQVPAELRAEADPDGILILRWEGGVFMIVALRDQAAARNQAEEVVVSLQKRSPYAFSEDQPLKFSGDRGGVWRLANNGYTCAYVATLSKDNAYAVVTATMTSQPKNMQFGCDLLELIQFP